MENTDNITNKSTQLTGKVVLITGATSGVGEITAEALAAKGAEVVIVGRSAERAEASVDRIRQASNNPHVSFLLADFSSLHQVRQLAGQFLQRYQRLDILINNAGAINFKRKLSEDGYELTFAVNHLSHFLLTNVVLEKLRSTAREFGEARIINVASEAHRSGKIYFEDLMFEKRNYEYGGFRAYAQSKLANILFSFELARRLNSGQITANALHPGFVASGFGKNNGGIGRAAINLIYKFGISPSEGAQTIIYLACWPEVKGVSGKYYDKCQPVQAAPVAYDLEVARKLWEISEELTSG